MKKYNIFQNMKFTYSRVFKKVPKTKLYLILNFFCTLLVPICGTLVASIVVYALTNHFPVDKYVYIIIGLSVLTFLLTIIEQASFQKYTWENTFIRCSDFWTDMSMHLITTDYCNVEPKDKQVIMSKAFEALSSNWVGLEMLMKCTPPLFINATGLLVYGVLISVYSPLVLIILLSMSVVNFLLTKYANNVIERHREESNREYREREYLAGDIADINNGKDIRLYKLEEWFVAILSKINKKFFTLSKKFQGNFLIANVSNSLFMIVRDLVAYTTLITMVINKEIDISTFTFLIGIVGGFSTWLNGFVFNFNKIRTSNIEVNEYREAFTVENAFNHKEGVDIKSLTKPLSIEFDHVSFCYPSSKEKPDDEVKPTIKDLCLKINGGDNIALVGENGAGKTTIVKLLCGLYTPTEGRILLNGIDIKLFNLEDYMSLLSVVFQDSMPLGFSIEKNITCACDEEVNKDKLMDALKKADLYEKVESLPMKEQTFITQLFDEKGIRLSGGETQKMMLARAIYKSAPLLILDEPTSALDPLSEEKMYLTYESFSRDNTSIFISHRLASTKFCNKIVYLENGTVKEQGTHNELMNRNGSYKEMFDIQSKYYTEEE